jgi:hypothetical protein
MNFPLLATLPHRRKKSGRATMIVTLSHTIVHARDKAASAKFLTEILGYASPKTLSHFTVVQVGETSLDFLETDEKI